MSEVTLESISFQYPSADRPQLHDFDLHVPAGTCLALLGPSGCSKTTVLRLIAGLERPTSGTISLGDRAVAGPSVFVPAQHRHVGLVFQDYALFPHLTVAKNIAYGLFSFPRAERSTRVNEVLEMVELEPFAQRYPWQLSGGQQQRVALARALAPQPQVLLLDEPFSNLDTDLRSSVREDVRDLLQTAGVTSVLVTHDEEDAQHLASQTHVMTLPH
ncbi:MAG: ABC transporter ATP-binding protein [Actinomycetaceae bacterium]|nr:ABC transporter ATP-binding protein [Actinomycetaceae bacterium]